MNRIGYYCWAGPGTIRMINLKYFSPPMDEASIMGSYEYEYLEKIKNIFGITDFWATYSWGFGDKRELEDREFLLKKVVNFKRLGIKLHAYIQGPNVVYDDFKERDWYCVDNKKRPIMYFRGRRVVCLNNPEFKNYIKEKINGMYNKGFDGVFMDNIQMGQLGIPTPTGTLPFNFVGCNCKNCQGLFKEKHGLDIPLDLEENEITTKKYLDFRVQSTNSFLEEVSLNVHNGNMEFGTNSFDPKFNMNYVYGTDLKYLSKVQDYLLFENHSLPSKKKNNAYINKLINEIDKPTFVISYRKGIGHESDFSQNDFDNIYSEDKQSRFFACIKGSEYTTNGVWHNLNPDNYIKPASKGESLSIPYLKPTQKLVDKVVQVKLFKQLLKSVYNPMETWYLESKIGRKVLGKVFSLVTQ